MLNSLYTCFNATNVIARDNACNAIAQSPDMLFIAGIAITAAIATALYRAI